MAQRPIRRLREANARGRNDRPALATKRANFGVFCHEYLRRGVAQIRAVERTFDFESDAKLSRTAGELSLVRDWPVSLHPLLSKLDIHGAEQNGLRLAMRTAHG